HVVHQAAAVEAPLGGGAAPAVRRAEQGQAALEQGLAEHFLRLRHRLQVEFDRGGDEVADVGREQHLAAGGRQRVGQLLADRSGDREAVRGVGGQAGGGERGRRAGGKQRCEEK